jgi:predicted ArsR family transcriptional regulator
MSGGSMSGGSTSGAERPTPDHSSGRSDLPTKEQIVRSLQVWGRATVGELADHCGVSDAAMRQHLDQLEAEGLVGRAQGEVSNATTRGRPPSFWTLVATERLHASFPDTFPDRHSDLTGELLQSIRDALGQEALDKVLDHRARRQIDDYRRHFDSTTPSLSAAVRVLAARRDAEGYRAEAVDHGDGTMSLVEHHCAIDAAKATCGELCESELKVFGKALDRMTGTKVIVRRVEHLAAGDSCCRYEIRPR